MKKLIKKALGNKLIKDNLILFAGMLILNILGFGFHFYMGRRLGPADYGVLGALLSIAYLMLIPMNTIQTGIAKFTSKFKNRNEFNKITYLFKKSNKRLFLVSIGIFIVFVILSKPLAIFLKIPLIPVLITGLFIFLVFTLPITRGVLQGLQRFPALSFNLVAEGAIKFFGGVFLVWIGYGVNGAVGSMVLSFFLAYLIGFYPLRKLLSLKGEKFNTKEVYSYSLPILIMLVSLTMFYSLDMMIVKHFFDNVSAGYYSALSLLGKIIFFGSISISQVMFPKVSESFSNGDGKHKKILYSSLGLVGLFSLAVILVYLFLPNLVVGILYGSEYMSIINLVWVAGLFMGLFSLIYTIAFYEISINNKKFIYILFLFNIIEIGLIWMFHSSLAQVLWILVGVMACLFIVLLIKASLEKKNDGFVVNNPSIQ